MRNNVRTRIGARAVFIQIIRCISNAHYSVVYIFAVVYTAVGMGGRIPVRLIRVEIK